MAEARQLFRSLGRRWGSSLVLVLLCALGVAISTTVFAVVKAVLHDPLPYPESDRLTVLWGVAEGFGIDEYPFSFENYKDYRDQTDVFEELAAWRPTSLTLEGSERPVSAVGARVTPNLLPMLRVEPILGRGFSDADDGVALIGYALWQRQFAGAPDVLGRVLRLDGQPFEVVGVLPPALRFPTPETELFIPLRITTEPETNRAFHFLRVAGRLRSGVGLEQAQPELRAVAARLREAYPDASGELDVRALSLKQEVVGGAGTSLRALFAGAQLLFVIAWANVAILLLARGMARRGELELRVALGATRPRLFRLLLGEALVLAGLGCGLGLGAGWLAVSWLPQLDAGLLPRAWEIHFDPSLVGWAAGLTLLGALVFGTAPAWSATRAAAAGPATTSRTTDRRTARFNGRLVAAQVALALPLLVASSMQLRSVRALGRVDPGYPLEGALTASVSLPVSQFGPGEHGRYIQRALEQLRQLPGVAAVGSISHLPFSTRAASIVTYRPDMTGQTGLPNAHYRVVSEGLFAGLGLPLVAGRDFDASDDKPERPVVIVDATLAAALWPDRDPVGRVVRLGTDTSDWEVVGVAAPARLRRLDQPPDYMVYVTAAHNRFPGALSTTSFLLRGPGASPAQAARVRDTLQRVDPRQAVLEVRPLEAQSHDWLGDRRVLAQLLWLIGGAALTLAAAGMYATLAFAVASRLREMAIRSALGANAASLAGRVVFDGLRPGLVGSAVGVVVCLVGARVVAGQVYGVPAVDLPSLAFAVGLLLLAGLLASGAPARRAVRESPARLLQESQP